MPLHYVDPHKKHSRWYTADLDDESIARHRADAARKKTDHDPAKRWAHLTELRASGTSRLPDAQPWRTCMSNGARSADVGGQ